MKFWRRLKDQLVDFFTPSKTGAIDRPLIEKALKQVIDPNLGKDLLSLGLLQGFEVQKKKIILRITPLNPTASYQDEIRSQVVREIKKLLGGSSISIQVDFQRVKAKPTPPRKTEAPTSGLTKVGQIIGVASGKGGVGKSTTSVQLACALKKLGAKVGLFDADIYGPSIHIMTGVGSPKQMSVNLVLPPEKHGIKLMSAAMFVDRNHAQILRGPMAANFVSQMLTQSDWGELDYLIIDYPPGTGDIQLSLSQKVDVTGVILVTTPQEVSVVDVTRAFHLFDTLKVPVVGLLENMSWFGCDRCDKKHYLFGQGGGKKLSQTFGIPFLGELPMEPQLAQCSDEGVPYLERYSSSPVSQTYLQVATALTNELSRVKHRTQDSLRSFELTWRSEN